MARSPAGQPGFHTTFLPARRAKFRRRCGVVRSLASACVDGPRTNSYESGAHSPLCRVAPGDASNLVSRPPRCVCPSIGPRCRPIDDPACRRRWTLLDWPREDPLPYLLR